MEQLHYTDTVQGNKAIIFLHYFGGSALTWQPVIDELRNDFRCIAIDMPGFGHSAEPVQQPSVHNNRDAVLALLEALQVPDFSLVGHSMGGKIALAIAAVKIPGISNIVLFAPSPATAEPMTKTGRMELVEAFGNKEKIEKHIQKITASPLPENLFNQTVTDNLNAGNNAWMGWLNKGSMEDISGEMSNITVPVMVVSGNLDEGLTTEFLKTNFEQYFSNVSFSEIKNSGHLLPLEQPDAVVTAIRQAMIS